MNRYFVYCRKSTEEETRQVNSLGKQKLLLQEVIERFGLEVINTFEESRSAKDLNNRPMFNDMIERIKNGEANCILTLSTDRLSRNLSEADVIIKLFDSGTLKEVRTPTNLYNTSKDFFYMGFDFLFATQYSRDLSIKVKEGFSSKIKKGIFPHQAPLGYLNVSGQIVPDPDRFPLIQTMFDLVERDFYSTRQVTEAMRQHGLKSRNGASVCKSRIYGMLSNPFYCGDMLIKGVLYPATHTPAISRKTFDTVQVILHSKARPRPKTRYFTFRNYLSCGECFCKLTATIKKGKYNYYYCTNGKGVCDQHRKYLPEKTIDKLLEKVFEPFDFPQELIDKSFELYKENLTRHNTKVNNVVAMYQSKLNDLDKQEGLLTTKLLQGIVSDNAYQLAIQHIYSEKQRFTTQMAERRNPAKPKITLELLECVRKTAVSGYEMYKNGDLETKKSILKSALWNCMITDGKVTNIRYKFPYGILQKYSKNDDFVKMRG